MTALRLDDVTKRFGGVTALDGVSLELDRGEVFGFLGPNGAGKSTTIDVLLDYVRPTSGTATVLGHDAQAEPRAVHARTGVLPDATSLTGHLTARQHVRFAVESKGADDRPLALLDRVGILVDGGLVASDTLDGVSDVHVDGATVSVACPDDRKAAVIDAVRADGAGVADVRTSDASLDDLFAAYTEGEM